jgi:hypothetical protein
MFTFRPYYLHLNGIYISGGFTKGDLYALDKRIENDVGKIQKLASNRAEIFYSKLWINHSSTGWVVSHLNGSTLFEKIREHPG